MRTTYAPRAPLAWVVAVAVLTATALLAACSGSASPITRTSQTLGKDSLPPGMDAPEVRVLLSGAAHTGSVPVRIKGAWSLQALDGTSLRTGRGLSGELNLSGNQATIAGAALPRDGAIVVPQEDGDLRIGERVYPGVLRVARSVDGKQRAYVVMDLETYVAGVVPGEIPAIFAREAQRTQAILARTYALSSIPAGAAGAPIVVSDSGGTDQEYHGLPAMPEHRRIADDAAKSTRGLVLLDGAEPLRAWYHSTCGGHTASAASVFGVPDRVALSGVKCDWCTSSKYFRWTSRLPGEAVVRAAGLKGGLERFTVIARDAGGRATRMRIQAGGVTRDVDAPAFRLRVGPSLLRSCLLDDSKSDRSSDILVAGRGWGHGVGLCQIGAKTLAEQAVPADQILRTYYPGTKVVKLW